MYNEAGIIYTQAEQYTGGDWQLLLLKAKYPAIQKYFEEVNPSLTPGDYISLSRTGTVKILPAFLFESIWKES
jgi:hypothetical protein